MRAKSMFFRLLCCLLFLLPIAVCPAANGNIIYVDDDGLADFSTIQAAIDDANDGDTVLVAPGTYTGEGNRDINFKGKAITVRSEEGPQTCIIDCQGTKDDPHRGFYFQSHEDANSVVQGFTVTQGYMGTLSGGAFKCIESSPIIRDCIIVGNATRKRGGGIYAYRSDLRVENCIIKENTASYGDSEGGGIFVGGGNAQLRDCLVVGNAASDLGGGIYCRDGDHQIINCTVTGNRTGKGGIGGGILFGPRGGDISYLHNSIVWGNRADYDGNDIGLKGIPIIAVMRAHISNSLIGKDPNSVYDPSALISGEWLRTDPMFALNGYWDPNGSEAPRSNNNPIWVDGDYHLKSQAGRWDLNSQSWIIDYITSLCIDAGDPNMPVGDEPEPNGGRINMGAYGGTPEASKSYILAKTIYVDDDAVGLNDGSSWQNAYTFLQDALADAKLAEKAVEIRVAQGIYKPNQRMLQTPDDGDNTFTLVNEMTVKGGYAGFDEPDPNARDIETCKTILSGDLNGDDIVVEDPCDMLLIQSNRGDNSSVVVRANHTDATAVLDGFVITGGYFMHRYTGPPNGGAGMHIYQGSPTIRNCTFTGNAARQIGGGLLNRGGSNPTLINCAFTGNYAESGGGIYNNSNMPAPGMISEDSHPTLVSCTFDNNYALKNGGGMYNSASNPTLIDCTFRRNQVTGPYSGSGRGPHTGGGGGMYNSNSNPVLTNCLFSENSAGDGGGICSLADSNVTLTNSTFNGNSASVRGGGLSNRKDNNLTLTNCRFIDNTVTGDGGGISNSSSDTTLVGCLFIGNSAHDGQIPNVSQIILGHGGGMSTGGTPTLIRCAFRSNYATNGAGIRIAAGELVECIFTGNSAIEDGGAILTGGSSSELVINNCTFSGNSANRGGGIFFTWGAMMTMANCTFAGNSAYSGNALASDPNLPSLPGYFQLTNCILWDGENTIFDPDPYALRSAIAHSNVQGVWPGEGNTDTDPLFAAPGYWADVNDPNVVVEPDNPYAFWVEGDYHLKSQAGRWDPVSDSWIQDDVTSPCIDAGDPNGPIGHEPFPNGGIINMGAYGGTAEASKSFANIGSRF